MTHNKKHEAPNRLTMNHQLIPYSLENYKKLYTSNEYIFYNKDKSIGLISSSGNYPNYFLHDETGALFQILEKMKTGLYYAELKELLSSCVDDPDSVIAELWQKGAII